MMPVRVATSRRSWACAAGIALCAVALLALDASAERRLRHDLQGRADAAADAGLRALVASEGEEEADRRQAAVAAGRRVTDRIANAHSSVAPSVSELKVSVRVAARAHAGVLHLLRPRRIEVVATAGFLPPDAGPDSQPPLSNRLDRKIDTARSAQ